MLDGIEYDEEKWEKESKKKDEDTLFPPINHLRRARVNHAGKEQGRKGFSNCSLTSSEKSKSQ